MKKAILGKKLGMTQIFDENDAVVPVTVVAAAPNTVVRKKTVDKDGYDALVVAFDSFKCDEKQLEHKLNKPEYGVFKKAQVAPKRYLREFRLDNAATFEVGKDITCDIFNVGDVVDVSGTSKGHGFTGVIKRWNHHRLKMTHGTGPVHRSVGSTGANSSPSRKIKGLKMPGQYGAERVTVQNLKVVKVDAERGILLIRGGVPGANGSLLTITDAVKAR